MPTHPADADPAALELRVAGIRPTSHRVLILRLLRQAPCCSNTADSVLAMVRSTGTTIAAATAYNSLNEFARAGLVRRIAIADRVFFCSTAGEHHHFFNDLTGELSATPDPQPKIVPLPPAPKGTVHNGVELVLRVRREKYANNS